MYLMLMKQAVIFSTSGGHILAKFCISSKAKAFLMPGTMQIDIGGILMVKLLSSLTSSTI